MALTYDQVSGITQKKFLPKLVDNIFDSNPLLKRMKDRDSYKKLDGGTSIMVPLNYAQASASGWYSGAATLDTTDNEVITAAEYQWRQSYVNVSISRLDELKNSGDSQILSLVKSKMQVAEKTLADILGTGIFNAGTDAQAIAGLRHVVATSNTVGGISQSSYSWWQGQVDSSTTTLSISALQSLWNLATIDSDHPTVGITTRTLFNSYYNLLQPQQRFMDKATAEGGFENLMFNGAPVIVDSHCPASHFFFLNEKYLFLAVHKSEDFRMTDFQKPVNQNVKLAQIFFMGAFGSDNIRMQALASALTS